MTRSWTQYNLSLFFIKKKVVGACPTNAELEEVLKSHKFKLVTITHVDTSTGVLTDVEVFIICFINFYSIMSSG